MDIKQTLLAKLRERGDLAFSEMPSGVRIEAPVPSGFSVSLSVNDGDEATVFLGDEGFHEHFDDGLDALDFIAQCFSGQARLRETWRGDTLQKIAFETMDGGKWVNAGTYGLIVAPFWKDTTERILQNPDLRRC